MVARISISSCAFDICALVAKRKYGEAVRCFEVLANESAPRARHESAAGLIHAGGPKAGEALTKAFARAPCYFCRAGRMTCDLCGGVQTFAANGRFCESCAGQGRVICTFCGGSGFLPFDTVPKNLTGTVAKWRLQWAASCLREVVRSAAKLKGAGPTLPTWGNLLRLFNAVQRVAAILDDVEPLILGHGGREFQDSGTRRLIRECRRVSDGYHHRLATGIAAFCHRQAAREQEGSPRRMAWERQLGFFETEAGTDDAAPKRGSPVHADAQQSQAKPEQPQRQATHDPDAPHPAGQERTDLSTENDADR